MHIVSRMPAIETFIAAVNRFDLDAFVATFADDAIVNDHQCELRGLTAIREWAAREIIGGRVTMAVIETNVHGNSAVVRAAIDGDFNKASLPSPFVLAFYFSLDRDRIAQLVIVHDRPPSTTKQTVRRFFERFAAGDVAGTVALFHGDATYWFPTTRETLAMPAFAKGLEWIQSRLVGGIRFELGDMIAEANKVAVQAESFATTVDGKPFNNRYHIYFEFDGDRIKRCREYNDTAHVFATLRAGQQTA
jgi:ketosteroid isomerase-like protein